MMGQSEVALEIKNHLDVGDGHQSEGNEVMACLQGEFPMNADIIVQLLN